MCPIPYANSGINFDSKQKHVDNYSIAKVLATTILDRISSDETALGFMPHGKSELSAADISVAKKWIDDGLLEK